MAKVSIVSPEMAVIVPDLAGDAEAGETRAYLSAEKDPIHVYTHRLKPSEQRQLVAHGADTVLYIWKGEVTVGGHVLSEGSSILIERGAAADLVAGAEPALVASFASSRPAGAVRDDGGERQVHLLPGEHVPRYSEGALGGGLHADATHPHCPVWLHENSLPAPAPDAPRTDPDAGVHSHAEDEVILVTEGQIRLGARLYDTGTLIAIAAETMYSFTVGPAGLKFVNFRPGLPDAIRFKNGMMIDEVGYWRSRVAEPRYISIASAVPAETRA